MTLIRRAALLFALFLGLVIVLANTGRVGAIFGWIYFFPEGDKVAHFLLWGMLALLVSLGFSTTRVQILSIKVLKSSLIIAVPVILEEISQLFFPERSASLLDLAAGLAGVFLLGEMGAWLRRVWLARANAAASTPPNMR